jgi:diguanylate cyclase (GGDEF)-like protein
VKTALLILDGVAPAPGLVAAAGANVFYAKGREEALLALDAARPSALVCDLGVAWHRELVAGLGAERRPAVLALGSPDAALADEWLSPESTKEEAARRLDLACQRARLRRQSARRAYLDFLTGLPNRRAAVRALVREANRMRRRAGALSLVLIDLDDFKAVNELGGHPAGDRLLRKVGAALRKVTRADENCGRVGGDEFALVIPAELSSAQRSARRAQDTLAAIDVSASVAVCELQPGERLRDLYRRTDRELKAAKLRRGRLPGHRGYRSGKSPAPVPS